MAQPLDDISAIHRNCDECGMPLKQAFIWPTDKQAGGQMVVEMLCPKCHRKRKRAK